MSQQAAADVAHAEAMAEGGESARLRDARQQGLAVAPERRGADQARALQAPASRTRPATSSTSGCSTAERTSRRAARRSGGMRLHLLAAVALTAATAPVAHADGLPVGNLDTTRTGVTVPASSERYFAIQDGGRTVVTSVYRDGGLLQAARRACRPVHDPGRRAGRHDDRAVARTARTLVLVRPRLTLSRSGAPGSRCSTPARCARAGRSTCAATSASTRISPDGRSLYLIQYTSPRDPLAYRGAQPEPPRRTARPGRDRRPARARRGDARAADGAARRAPTGAGPTRSTTAPARDPFVHALDTTGRTARCIDLPALPGGVDIAGLSLVVRGRALQVRSGAGPIAFIDRRTFATRAAGRRRTRGPRTRPAAASRGPWRSPWPRPAGSPRSSSEPGGGSRRNRACACSSRSRRSQPFPRRPRPRDSPLRTSTPREPEPRRRTARTATSRCPARAARRSW